MGEADGAALQPGTEPSQASTASVAWRPPRPRGLPPLSNPIFPSSGGGPPVDSPQHAVSTRCRYSQVLYCNSRPSGNISRLGTLGLFFPFPKASRRSGPKLSRGVGL